jgi:hypothetical protein
MNARSIVVASVIGLAAAGACGPRKDSPVGEGAWVGTIATEGSVTTVVNEAGSVWGGTARLVEEASIGVETGADEYMFGNISGLWASEDRIFVSYYRRR